jgi:hypothetical protein
LGSDSPKKSPQIARIAKIPKQPLFWQTDDFIAPPKLGEFLTIRRGRHQKDGDKKRGSGSTIRCIRIDFNLFRFGFVSKSESYLGNKFSNLCHMRYDKQITVYSGFYSLILMICTGQRSAASFAQGTRSSVGIPSAILPLIRYFSMIRLNESSGSCSNNPGQVSQQDPQLTQVARSIITFTDVLLDSG